MKPFVRWVGGKTRLMPIVEELMRLEEVGPKSKLVETCVGGGSAFMKFGHLFNRAELFDTNELLVNAWLQVKVRPFEVARAFNVWREASYEGLRMYLNTALESGREFTSAEAGAFLVFNKGCFNGLYRTNRKGRINVAQGTNWPVEKIQLDHYAEASVSLRNAKVQAQSVLRDKDVGPGDRVFVDPPYLGEFSKYDKAELGDREHAQIHRNCLRWAMKGALVVLCASNNERSRKIYGEPDRVGTLNRTVGHSLRAPAKEAFYVYGEVE